MKLYSWDKNIDRLYVSRKEGGSVLTSDNDCIDVTILETYKYTKKSKNSSHKPQQ